jgi:hypothetical protein
MEILEIIGFFEVTAFASVISEIYEISVISFFGSLPLLDVPS